MAHYYRGLHATKNKLVDLPDENVLGWFTIQMVPAPGWFVVKDNDPDGVEPMAAWLTQELRRFGGVEVYDTRVVGALADAAAETYVYDDSAPAGLVSILDIDRVIHESRLDAHLARLRREATS